MVVTAKTPISSANANNYGDGELVASFTVDLDSTNGGFDTISFGNSAEPSIATGGAFSANSSFVRNGESITPDYFFDTSYLSSNDNNGFNPEGVDGYAAMFGSGGYSAGESLAVKITGDIGDVIILQGT